jgi:hypothetical protein
MRSVMMMATPRIITKDRENEQEKEVRKFIISRRIITPEVCAH